MAHTKAKGTSKLGRDSNAQRLGVKLFGGQKVGKGMVIIRQRGTKYHLGENVRKGTDDTIFALTDGVVKFFSRKKRKFNNRLVNCTFVSVIPGKK